MPAAQLAFALRQGLAGPELEDHFWMGFANALPPGDAALQQVVQLADARQQVPGLAAEGPAIAGATDGAGLAVVGGWQHGPDRRREHAGAAGMAQEATRFLVAPPGSGLTEADRHVNGDKPGGQRAPFWP